MDYAPLKSEIDTDPLALGYKNADGSWKSNHKIADLINEVPATPTTGRMIVGGRTVVDSWEVVESTVDTEWAGLSSQEKQRYQSMVAAGKVNVAGENTRQAFRAMFANGTTTRTNLLALQNQSVSRALFLFGVPVEDWDVARAKEL